MMGIKDIVSYFEGDRIAVSDLLERAALEPAERQYFGATGIETVYHANGADGYHLARSAAQKLMERNKVSGQDIDLIIYIQNRLPPYLMSSSTARLQHDLGAVNAVGFSLADLGCTDMSMALQLAHDFLAGHSEAGLVLICYGNSPYTPSRFRYPVTINGDGAVALFVSRTADNRVVDINIKMKGAYWDLFKVDCGDRTYAAYKEECSSQRKYGFELAIESRLQVQALNEKALSKSGLVKEEVAHHLLQNLTLRSFEVYENAFEISIANVCRYNLRRYGHLGPADIMLNYQAGLETGLFQKGEYVLLMNNSPVASWSNILIEV